MSSKIKQKIMTQMPNVGKMLKRTATVARTARVEKPPKSRTPSSDGSENNPKLGKEYKLKKGQKKNFS